MAHFRIHPDPPAGLLDHSVNRRQSQARAGAFGFRRKKRLKQSLQDVARHPDSAVGYREHDVRAELQIRVGDPIRFGEGDLGSFDNQEAAVAAGVVDGGV